MEIFNDIYEIKEWSKELYVNKFCVREFINYGYVIYYLRFMLIRVIKIYKVYFMVFESFMY